MKTLLVLGLIFSVIGPVAQAAAPAQLRLSLHDAESQALAYSQRLQSAEYDKLAADARALAVSSQTSLQLTFDATYRHYSQIPKVTLPGGYGFALGDNNVYSIGPTLTYLLYDAGSVHQSAQSASLYARAKSQQMLATREDVLLATRSAYFAVQNSAERMRLIADSLRLAKARYADMTRRLGAGAASQADALSAEKDVLDFGLKLRQAQADLATDLADLLALIGHVQDYDVTRPVEVSQEASYPADLGNPTVLLTLDPLQQTLARFLAMSRTLNVTQNPRMKALGDLAQSSRLASKSIADQRWPKIQLLARTSLDYPNGPILEQINQNTIGVTLSMPLFDAGRTSALEREQLSQANSLDAQRAQLQTDLTRDWDKVDARLSALRAQEVLAKKGVDETSRLAQLTYDSYRAGRDRFLEVQTADLEALNWQVNLALIKSQILVQLAVQASLSAGSNQ